MTGPYAPRTDLLSGRIVLVTGAGDGIGRVAAESFAAFGAQVILLGRTTSKLEATYDSVQAKGPEPFIAPFDLHETDEGPYDALASVIDERFGRLDGLLHSAGILGRLTPIEHVAAAAWHEVIQVNLTSEFLLTKALLPLLQRSDDASIVFTSSGVGREGRAYWGPYAVSKFGVEGLMEVLADELENTSHVRCNSLNPGGTRTHMRAQAYPAEDPASLPTPEKHMPLYLYLMGPDSKGVTGQRFDAQSWVGEADS
jgi:NAD(P)-dependent dehydrogenase (short-subunit alcohol dehydrogenase family)